MASSRSESIFDEFILKHKVFLLKVKKSIVSISAKIRSKQ